MSGIIKIHHNKLMPMAAKAAGSAVRITFEEDGQIAQYWNELGDVWCPLHDRDDAHILSVALLESLPAEHFEQEENRLAVVKRAAEIGVTMK